MKPDVLLEENKGGEGGGLEMFLRRENRKNLRYFHTVPKGRCQKHPEGGVHKIGGGRMIFPKNAFDNFWRECSSNVIILGGMWSHFIKIWREAKKIIEKFQNGRR